MYTMKPTFIDLFAGAGGMSLGFVEAGFENIFSIEISKDFSKTYQENFKNHNLIIGDIKELREEEILNFVHGRDVDTVIGGPPCQGFSLAGRIGRSFIEDERNFLFKEFVRVVDIVKPKTFVLENVARMQSHNKGKTIEEIVIRFKNIGYKVQHKVLQAADYGVPQKRSRIFIIGIREDLGASFEYPKATTKTYKSVSEAIGDLPPLSNGEQSGIPNHRAMRHTSQMLKKMSYIQDGGDRSQIPEKLRPRSGDSRKYIKYNSQEPSVTVTGDMRKIFHYSQNRALTPRELARLQSFPDNFIFKGKSISIQQQIGNAVPPLLAYVLANEIKKTINQISSEVVP